MGRRTGDGAEKEIDSANSNDFNRPLRGGSSKPLSDSRQLRVGKVHAILKYMGEPARKILSHALELPAQDRAELAAELIASLDGESETEVEAAWAAEIRRRVAKIKSGEAKFEDWDSVRAQFR